MKKHLLLIIPAVATLCTGCNLDDPENISSYHYKTLNLITAIDPDSDISPLLTESTYDLSLNESGHTLTMVTKDLLFDNATHTVETQTLRYSAQGFIAGTQTGSFVTFLSDADISALAGSTITSLRGQLNSTLYPAGSLQSTLVVSYILDDTRRVRTLRADSYFCGTSSVTAPDGTVTATEEGVYRLIINPSSKTAQLVFGRIPLPLSDSAPESISLASLPLDLSSEGYSITSDAPQIAVPDNGDASQTEGWSVTDLNLRTSDSSLTTLLVSFSLTSPSGETAKVRSQVRYTLM